MIAPMIAPGATIGILGGGQLARMLALAAAPLGYRCHVYAPRVENVAADVCTVTRGAYDDKAALAAFAAEVDVITYEFENVPAETVEILQALKPVHPRGQALAVAQDRLVEKQFASRMGGQTAPFRAVDTLADLEAALAEIGAPAILKTRRMGYDGKGQARIASPDQAAAAFAELGAGKAPGGLILEGFVAFEREFSILLARRDDGETRAFPPCHNIHENGILAQTRIPAVGLDPAHVEAATALVARIAEDLAYVGILACEFFAGADGPLFNEMAPRVHNSGHWTIEGTETSQFEQHIRAVCGLPLGGVGVLAGRVEMANLLGNEIDQWADILAEPDAHLHLYGKSEALPGRKMGHVTRLFR